MTDTSVTERRGPEQHRFGLRWAIKPSFTDYVMRMSDGRAYLAGGVAVNAENELSFELDEQAEAVGQAEAAQCFTFRGEVLFSAHFGMLSVRISAPSVVLRGADGALTVADPDSEGGRLSLVTFTAEPPVVEDGVQRWDANDVRLTSEGADLFGEVYQAGEPFAPLAITIPVTVSVEVA